jgi:hypothetical protein
MNKVLAITGSRHWTCHLTIEAWLRTVPKGVHVIHGACPDGADAIADEVAQSLGFKVVRFPVEEQDGRWPSAGPMRNERMLRIGRPGRVWAFRAGGKSSGTDDCVRRALARRIACTTIPEGSRP